MVDVSKIKAGDEITVRYAVEDVAPQDRFSVRVKSRDVMLKDWFSASEIATHIPAPRAFASGDKVTWAGGGKGEIIAIADDFAWVKSGDTRPSIHISYLCHADAPTDEIIVTEEEASRAFDFFYASESGACEGAMQKTLVDFLKRRKGAGR